MELPNIVGPRYGAQSHNLLETETRELMDTLLISFAVRTQLVVSQSQCD